MDTDEDDEIIFPDEMIDIDIDIENLLTGLIRHRIQTENNSALFDMFDSQLEEAVPLCVTTEFQTPTYERLFHSVDIEQYADACCPVVRDIMINQIEHIMRIACVIRDDRNAKIITHSDIIGAIKIRLGQTITKNRLIIVKNEI
jgi:hypothetical protein